MSLDRNAVAFVRELVYRRSAIVLDDEKNYLIEARLQTLAAEKGFGSPGALVDAARVGAPLQTSVVEAMTTNETSFFRDVLPFDCLRETVLPRLVAARAPVRSLVVWCGACSTGQEPYSIAMLIMENFPQLAGWNIKILATDLADHVLERAREGRFRQLDVNRGLPVPYLLKYFERDGAVWQVKPEVRRLIQFGRQNLIESLTLPQRPDVVFLRNVLIYFDQVTKRSILERIRKAMAADGALFLGAAETTLGVDDGWKRVPVGKAAYYEAKP